MGANKKQKNSLKHALYRTYRPTSLDDVVSQDHVTKVLSNAVKSDNITHAYLFTGPRGTGKTSVARILAHEINNLPYDGSSYLDIIEIDAASNRKIDDIRDLKEKVNIAPVSSRYKVYIIDEVHMLTNESFNALLKTLEEPPSHIVFILATTEVHKLPATILSRVQRHNFRLVPTDHITSHLQTIAADQKINITDEALKLLAKHAKGSLRDSISLLDQVSGYDGKIDQSIVEQLMGLAPDDQISMLLDALSVSSKQVIKELNNLLAAGVSPQTIASSLIDGLKDRILIGTLDKNSAKLMDDLLEVSSSSDPELKLMVSLISNVDNKSASSSTKAQVVSSSTISSNVDEYKNLDTVPNLRSSDNNFATDLSSNKTTATNNVQKHKTKSKSDSASSKVQSDPIPNSLDLDSIIDKWDEVLELIKSRHSPIFTVMRQSQPRVGDNDLTIYFEKPFYQKRVDDLKHKTIIATAVQEATGQNVEIKTAVDKSMFETASLNNAQVTTLNQDAQTESANASHIQAIRDMMGGGEVVQI